MIYVPVCSVAFYISAAARHSMATIASADLHPSSAGLPSSSEFVGHDSKSFLCLCVLGTDKLNIGKDFAPFKELMRQRYIHGRRILPTPRGDSDLSPLMILNLTLFNFFSRSSSHSPFEFDSIPSAPHTSAKKAVV